MQIKEIIKNKADFMDILLIGDEDENMINKYINQSTIFALYVNSTLTSVCAIIKVDNETAEIKNLSTYPEYQNRGYASTLIDFVCNKYKTEFKYLILGTGENNKTLKFYKKRGFQEIHRLKNFFIDNYSHPIYENGKQLIDMIYLKKIL
ncbi:TPA: GNAT family N-acetyltransferase [Candidatus Gastranaerophilales bacterium HUM_8]|nr:MAG TPA: GNAT family N-acetyltransferase [Candidatus Gastranaerophilales bacterium HUM_8]DAB02557.1 MAG TPA: GNAT family N-acetyltransferase [Candidatus Gastranaerophilales bacterium HUM_11]